MLTTDREKPLIANKDIECFKVMIKRNDVFYVCPPGFQSFLNNGIKLEEYHLNKVYETDSQDGEKDYRKDGVIGEGFYHTFCVLKSAKNFVEYLNDKINHPETTKHPELYKIPEGAKITILNAKIPKGALYYEGIYERKSSSERTYASNKIIYTSLNEE